MSMEEVNLAFHRPVGGRIEIPSGADAFWETIGVPGSEWNAGRTTNRSIADPNLRFLHYVIARTIFARGESAEKITATDLVLLWGMVSSSNVDIAWLWTWYIIHRMLRSQQGDITHGPFVTLIARHLQALTPSRGLERPDRGLYRKLTVPIMASWRFEPMEEDAPVEEDVEQVIEEYEPEHGPVDMPPSPPTQPSAAGPSTSRRRMCGNWDMDAITAQLTSLQEG